MMKKYFVEFNSAKVENAQAGFDVCLSIASLDLPLCIVCETLTPQLKSLKDFEVGEIFERKQLSDAEYKTLKSTASYFLSF